MYSSFFVPKSRKRYGCEMPALRAMSSVEVPTYPPSANSTSAASSTVSRRSAALMRVVVIFGSTSGRLVMTHKLVKSLRDPILLRLGQPLVQRQRERTLERRIGTREGALVAVG